MRTRFDELRLDRATVWMFYEVEKKVRSLNENRRMKLSEPAESGNDKK